MHTDKKVSLVARIPEKNRQKERNFYSSRHTTLPAIQGVVVETEKP
jgi:hypothetical protein